MQPAGGAFRRPVVFVELELLGAFRVRERHGRDQFPGTSTRRMGREPGTECRQASTHVGCESGVGEIGVTLAAEYVDAIASSRHGHIGCKRLARKTAFARNES